MVNLPLASMDAIICSGAMPLAAWAGGAGSTGTGGWASAANTSRVYIYESSWVEWKQASQRKTIGSPRRFAEHLREIQRPVGSLGDADADFGELAVEDVAAVAFRVHPAHDHFVGVHQAGGGVFADVRSRIPGLLDAVGQLAAFQFMGQLVEAGHVVAVFAGRGEQLRIRLQLRQVFLLALGVGPVEDVALQVRHFELVGGRLVRLGLVRRRLRLAGIFLLF